MWAYSHFFLNYGIFPNSIEQIITLISPYGYKFHFAGLVLGFLISLILFFRKISRYENKKIWIDIFFFSFVLSLIPLWIFLVFGDNFIGKPSSSSWLAIKALTTQSELNKFWAVYPVWLMLSFVSIFSVLITFIIKKSFKTFGYGIIGFILLIIWFNFVLLFQQYSKHGVISAGWISFDIKNYISFFVIMLCLHIHYNRTRKINKQV